MSTSFLYIGTYEQAYDPHAPIAGTLSDFVATNVGDQGGYENVRDLTRSDKERTEAEQFGRLKAELTRAFAAPQSSYTPLEADAVISSPI